MTKVSDMIGDYAEPRGDSGYAVDQEEAASIAGHMRQILNRDLEEIDVATEAQIYNRAVGQDEMIAAWELLNAGERASWRRFVNYDEWFRLEEIKRHAH